MKRLVLLLAVSSFATGCYAAPASSGHSEQIIQVKKGALINSVAKKKLIEAGWERPDASDLLKYQHEMEQTPYDGIVLTLNGKDNNRKAVPLQSQVFDPAPLKPEWFAQEIQRLQSFHSTKLTDNFVRVSVSPKAPDWFDDAGWKQVIEHWKIVANIAKEGKLKGICFDPELYAGATIFTYGLQQGAQQHSFDEYQGKARQRGREVIEAISKIDPAMVFFAFHMNGMNRKYANNLQIARYNLYPAFINGWLDAASPQMTFVDGGETAYLFTEPEEFYDTANWVRNTGLSLVAPENHQKYRSQVQVGFGLYLDAYSYLKPSSKFYLPPLNGSRLNRLQSNIEAAVDASDQYVWTWSEHYRWWPTNTKNVNPQSWEEVLPGTTKVLLDATHPERVATEQLSAIDQLIAQNKLPNLLTNGDFSDTTPNTSSPGAPDWETQNAPAGWSTWQYKTASRQPGIFSIEANSGENGGNAVCLAGMSQGFLIQSVAVKPGERYYVRARVRQQGKGLPRMDISFQNQQGVSDVKYSLRVTPANIKTDEWKDLAVTVTIPEHSTKIVLLVGVYAQTSMNDKVWCEKVGIFKLPS